MLRKPSDVYENKVSLRTRRGFPSIVHVYNSRLPFLSTLTSNTPQANNNVILFWKTVEVWTKHVLLMIKVVYQRPFHVKILLEEEPCVR